MFSTRVLLEYRANDWDQVTTKSIEGSGRPSRAEKEVCVGPTVYPGRAHNEGAESGDAISTWMSEFILWEPLPSYTISHSDEDPRS